ncbi:MAG TPA: hypothetical protein VL614_15085 [Acetobacteraceae bacterium]|jgi:hypothetical protein|nr:hypothetical protein [Acetobacteraceae bacterium]
MTLPEITAAMPLLPVGRIGKLSTSLRRDRMNSDGTYEPTPYDVTCAETKLEDLWKQDQADHAANAAAIEHNRALRATLTEIMKAAGIPDSYSERDHKSRSRFPKSIRRDAGYLGDLQRHIPISDGFSGLSLTYDRLKAAYAEHRKVADARQAAQKRKADAAIERRKADMELAILLVRYELPPESDWSDVLGVVRKRNQYLDLAIAMEDCRGDWSEGCYMVEAALDRFTITDDRDKEIATDAASGIASFGDGCGDGRVFRDTRWSYDALYALIVDQQLVADARRAREGARR